MSVHERTDRRGRTVRGKDGLLERDAPLQSIDGALGAARAGASRALLLVGHAGMGKTRLHEATLDGARRRGLRVIRAAGAELEQNLALGVAGELLRSLLADLQATQRRALLAQAPEPIQSLLGELDREPAEPDAEHGLAVSHGLFTLLASAAEERPALVAIDDLHWCDTASLELVLYLLHRLDELPIAIVMTRRPGADDESSDALDHIFAHPRLRVETLAPLGLDAVGKLVQRAIGKRTDPALVEVCRDATAGNPFYLRELLLALADQPGLSGEQLAGLARSLAPDAVTRSLRVRVGRLGPQAAALARAVSILGEDVPVRHAAALSGLTIAQTSIAADSLAAAEVLLAREPLRFVHPLVRQVIERDIPASERASRHLDAARLVYAEGAGVERVAAHLLLGRAEGNPWVVERLCAAAREARSRGVADSAVRYLARALAEPPAAEQRAEVLAELGTAEAVLGLPAAVEHLAAAAAAVTDPRRRAELALCRGHALYRRGLHEQAAAAYEEGLSELVSGPSTALEHALRDELQTGFVATGSRVPSLHARSIERASRLPLPGAEDLPTQGQRLLLAQAALQAASTEETTARAAELAGRAWDSGRLLEQEKSDGIAWSLVAGVLCLAGELERSIEIADAALADARMRGSALAFATAAYVRGLPQLWRGRVSQAVADLELARDGRRRWWGQFTRAAAAHYCLCLIEAGEPQRAEAALTEDAPLSEPYDLEDAMRLHALAELRRYQGRAEDALEAALAAGTVVEQVVAFRGYCPWRTSAAQAALAMGKQDQALELAAEALAQAERTGVVHERIAGLRVAGICEGGSAGIERLRSAVELGNDAPPRLETIRALVELGAALRRTNERAASRPPLQAAADAAKRGGAQVLYERARTELSASGARPRRDALLSGLASLTPSERRVAELAGAGHSNREIASALFVTGKTVEYHLRNTYRKLDIKNRGELAQALAE